MLFALSSSLVTASSSGPCREKGEPVGYAYANTIDADDRWSAPPGDTE
ncbi:hypothetical protein T261_5238 [Streptomyces lydicus]|nr:hypothetical protein T261_5238 [Streptomyces lydicus]